jgi:hypothetical protein
MADSQPPASDTVLIFGESYEDFFISPQDARIADKNSGSLGLAYLSYPHVSSKSRKGGINLVKILLEKIQEKKNHYICYDNNCKLKTYSLIKRYPKNPKNQKENGKNNGEEGPQVYRIEKFFGINEADFIRNFKDPLILNTNCKYLIVNDTGNGFFKSLGKQKYHVPYCNDSTCNKNNPKCLKLNSLCEETDPIENCGMNSSVLTPDIIFFATNPSHCFSHDVIREYYTFFQSKHNKNLIIITNINELRDAGGQISKSLSWERTIQDTIWQIQKNPKINHLLLCKLLIIRIDFEGAIVIFPSDNGKITYHLIFSPHYLEGGYSKTYSGTVKQTSTFFLTFFYSYFIKIISDSDKFHSIIEDPSKNQDIIIKIVKISLEGIQQILFEGLFEGQEEKKDIGERTKIIFDKIYKSIDLAESQFSDVKINPTCLSPNKRGKWSLLSEANETQTLGNIAYDLLIHGPEKYSKYKNNNELPFPVYKVGRLTSIDKSEIESYQSIRNIIDEYVQNKNFVTPVSIAVFGPPGAGKSFGLKQIISQIPNISKIDITCNLSQYSNYSELTNIFPRIRDAGLTGNIPVAFFDEFDSNYENTPLGWLKFFLTPMQDGIFFSHEHYHPFGKVIFIFAGGKYESFEQFVTSQSYSDQKGPDFASRLRGHIDIIGYNSTKKQFNVKPFQEFNYNSMDIKENGTNKINAYNLSMASNQHIQDTKTTGEDSTDDDNVFMVRRALLIRSLLLEFAPHLFKGEDRELTIDRNVLRALIKVSEYKHGARSIQEIIKMSLLSERKSFEPSCLPPRQMLMQHTDADDFLNLLRREYQLNEKSAEIFSKLILPKVPDEDYHEKIFNLIEEYSKNKNEIDERISKYRNKIQRKLQPDDFTFIVSEKIETLLHKNNLGYKRKSNVKIEFKSSFENNYDIVTDKNNELYRIFADYIYSVLNNNFDELKEGMEEAGFILYPI